MSAIKYLQFEIETTGNQNKELLIALLADIGFAGFEENEDGLSAFIREDDFRDEDFSVVTEFFHELSYTRTVIEHINWNQQWESSFQPVIVNDLAAVRAEFHKPISSVQYEVIITPKMSFGTGHHATTYMMIEQMGHLDMAGKNLLDFGTGTGVLSILAEKMGATDILAIDNDEWSINNTRENILKNDCSAIQVLQAECIPVNKTFNFILANINLNVINANLDALSKASVPGTVILLSGFLASDEEQMVKNINKFKFTVLNIARKGDWLCIRAIKE